jgi:hypothetical protein
MGATLFADGTQGRFDVSFFPPTPQQEAAASIMEPTVQAKR